MLLIVLFMSNIAYADECFDAYAKMEKDCSVPPEYSARMNRVASSVKDGNMIQACANTILLEASTGVFETQFARYCGMASDTCAIMCKDYPDKAVRCLLKKDQATAALVEGLAITVKTYQTIGDCKKLEAKTK